MYFRGRKDIGSQNATNLNVKPFLKDYFLKDRGGTGPCSTNVKQMDPKQRMGQAPRPLTERECLPGPPDTSGLHWPSSKMWTEATVSSALRNHTQSFLLELSWRPGGRKGPGLHIKTHRWLKKLSPCLCPHFGDSWRHSHPGPHPAGVYKVKSTCEKQGVRSH